MTVSAAQISSWLGTWLWALFRIGAALGAAPMFGMSTVPMRVRAGLAVAISLVIAPVLPPAPAVDPLGPSIVIVAAHEILVGAAMGFVLMLVFAALVHAGQIVALQIGLGFASMFDPQNGVPVPVLSQFQLILGTLLFLALDGHLALIDVLAGSFRVLPVGSGGLSGAGIEIVLRAASQMFAGALQIALPLMATLLLVNVAFGVMSRAAPQLNVFVVGFPLGLLFGFSALLYTLPLEETPIAQLVESAYRHVAALLAAGAP
jgi:flagellar biosynthetic protein FliR